MSIQPLEYMTDLQTDLNRIETMTQEVQRQALGCLVGDAESALEVIEAAAHLMTEKLGDMLERAQAVHDHIAGIDSGWVVLDGGLDASEEAVE